MNLSYSAALLLAAGTAQQAPAPQDAAASQPAEAADTVVLRRDTPLELMATSEITTATAKPGTRFKLRVNKPVAINGRTVVPIGAWVFGEVVSASNAGGLGKSGRMTAKLLHLQLGDALIPIDGDVSAKGTNAGSAGILAVVTLNPLMLFHRGNNAKIKAGEIVSAFVSQDVTLDLSAPAARRIDAPPPVASGAP